MTASEMTNSELAAKLEEFMAPVTTRNEVLDEAVRRLREKDGVVDDLMAAQTSLEKNIEAKNRLIEDARNKLRIADSALMTILKSDDLTVISFNAKNALLKLHNPEPDAQPTGFVGKAGEYIEDLKRKHGREVAILKERLRIAHEAFEKIDEITKEEQTAIVAGNADSRLRCDDHAFKYLFYGKED